MVQQCEQRLYGAPPPGIAGRAGTGTGDFAGCIAVVLCEETRSLLGLQLIAGRVGRAVKILEIARRRSAMEPVVIAERRLDGGRQLRRADISRFRLGLNQNVALPIQASQQEGKRSHLGLVDDRLALAIDGRGGRCSFDADDAEKSPGGMLDASVRQAPFAALGKRDAFIVKGTEGQLL
jgi:hypothetical protein